MSVNPAVRTLYSAQLLASMDPAHVWAEGCNTNYEGEIKGKGDVLRILTVPRPTVSSYTVGATITYERLRPAAQELHIDQDTHWAIAEDELERILSNPDTMQQMAREGAWALVDGSDLYLAKTMAAAAATTVTAAAIGNGASDLNAYDAMEQILEKLKEMSVPQNDLHIFIPIWFMTMLRTDARFTGFGTEPNRRTARGERIYEAAGLTIHETLNALDAVGTAADADGPTNTIVACWKGATTWGRHIPEDGLVQFIKSEDNVVNFDNRMRARYVYGASVVYPDAVVKQVVTKGTY